MRKAAFLGLAFAAMATAAIAQAPRVDVRSIGRIGAGGDPNQIVCVRQAHIESPLNIRRICRTRSEWTQLRRDTREVVERVQYFKQTF
jgi:hypothetical protein